MKIKESLFGLLFAYAGNAFAANDVVTVANIEVPQGESVELAIVLNNTTSNLSGWQCDLKFSDENLTLALNANGKPECTLGSRFGTTSHSLSGIKLTSAYRFVGESMEAEAIPETNGTLFSVTLEADASLEVGKTYTGTISDIEFHTNDRPDPQTILIDDVTFTITIGESDGRIHFNENATTLPKYTAGEDAPITMKRTIKANEWSTICLPFAMTVDKLKAAFGDDYDLEEFTGYDVEKDGDNIVKLTLNFTKNTKAAKINTPYIIKTSKDISEFEVSAKLNPVNTPKKSIVFEDDDTGEEMEIASMIGTYKNGTVVPKNSLFLSGNKFYYSAGKTKMKAFRAYFTLNDVLTEVEEASARISFSFDGNETTGVSEIVYNQSSNSKYYDLQGRRVSKPGKGLFVKDGKKVIIK